MADAGSDVAVQATLTFHRSLYLPDAVRDAAAAYEGYVEAMDVQENDQDTVVSLRGWDAGYGEEFIDHFANHVLFQTIVMTREMLGGAG